MDHPRFFLYILLLALFVLSFYIEVIAGLRVELGAVTSVLNLVIVLVMYGGIAVALRWIDTGRLCRAGCSAGG